MKPHATLPKALLAGLGAVFFVGSCRLALDPLVDQRCETTDDCPEFYSCVVGYSDGGRLCEVIFPPRLPPRDAGVDEGPYYCGEVQAVLNRTCVANCHGSDITGSQLDTFRLDYYEPPDGGTPGARAKASRVKARTFDFKDMPPSDFPTPPTQEERRLVADWVLAGAQFCGGDGGTSEPVDAGPQAVDGGRYATEIQPIWNQRCGPCHLTQNPREGQLDLSGLGSYGRLVNRASSCDTSLPRVSPGNTQGSALWRKLQNGPMYCGGFPAPMPRDLDGGLRPNFPADFDKVEQWITDGAPAN